MNYRKNVILFLCDSSRGIEDLFFFCKYSLITARKIYINFKFGDQLSVNV